MPRRPRPTTPACRVCGRTVRWATEVTDTGQLVRRPLDVVSVIAGRRYRATDTAGVTYASAVTVPGARGLPDHRDVCQQQADEPTRVRRDVDG